MQMCRLRTSGQRGAVLEVTAQIHYMIEATGGKPAGISDENIKIMQDFAKNSYGQGK